MHILGWVLKTRMKISVFGVKKLPFWKRDSCKPWPRVLGQTTNQGRGKFLILQEKESGKRVKKGILKKVTFKQET